MHRSPLLAATALLVLHLAPAPARSQETARFSGSVTNESGDILPGIKVTIVNGYGQLARTIETDAQGNWVLLVQLGDSPVYVYFSDPDKVYAREYFDDTRVREEARVFELERGARFDLPVTLARADRATIRGRVVDEDGIPLGGIDVLGTSAEGRLASAVTDRDGRYELEVDTDLGPRQIRFSNSGGLYQTEWHDDAPESASAVFVELEGGGETVVDATLRLRPTIEGTVTDTDGAPVAGVTVSSSTNSPGDVTDADGRYRIRVDPLASRITVRFDPPDPYDLEFFDDATFQAQATALTVPPQSTRITGIDGIDAVLETNGSIRGTVTDLQGEPISNVMVATVAADLYQTSDFTADDGSYEVWVGPRRGLVRVSFDHHLYEWEYDSDAATYEEARTHLVEYGDHVQVDARLTPKASERELATTIEGTVYDDTGTPLEGILVSTSVPSEISPTGFAHTTTGPDGTYLLAGGVGYLGSADGTVTVTFRDPTSRYGSARRDVAAGAGDAIYGIDATLEPAEGGSGAADGPVLGGGGTGGGGGGRAGPGSEGGGGGGAGEGGDGAAGGGGSAGGGGGRAGPGSGGGGGGGGGDTGGGGTGTGGSGDEGEEGGEEADEGGEGGAGQGGGAGGGAEGGSVGGSLPGVGPPAPGLPPGQATGDVHLVTLDGLRFDLQSAGEFVAARAAGGELEVQLRMEPYAGSDRVSVNTAVAARLGADRVTFVPARAAPLWLNGNAAVVAAGQPLELDGGGRIETTERGYRLLWPDGSLLTVDLYGTYANVYLSPAAVHRGALSGLLGDFDGVRLNDYVTADGVQLDHPPTHDELHGRFSGSWRVTPDASLFDYAPGENTTTFTDPGFPRAAATAGSLSAEARQRAEATCRAAGVTDPAFLEQCIVDVGHTGEDGFARSTQEAQSRVAEARAASLGPDPIASGLCTPPAVAGPTGAIRGGVARTGRFPAAPAQIQGVADWTSTGMPFRLGYEPMVVGGRVIAPTNESLVALDAASGQMLWEAEGPGGTIAGDGLLTAGGAVFAGWESALAAYEVSTGRECWRLPVGVPTGAVYADGRLFVGFDEGTDGFVAAVDAPSGRIVWRYDIRNGAPNAWPNPSEPALGDTAVYVADGQEVVALSSATGEVLWRSTQGGVGSAGPAFEDGVLYVPLLGRGVSALDAATGATRWAWVESGAVPSWPALSGDRIFVADTRHLHALDRETGAEVWSVDREGRGGFFTAPVLAGDRVLALMDDGDLMVLDGQSGEVIQELSLTDLRPYGGVTPIVVEGRLLVVLREGVRAVR